MSEVNYERFVLQKPRYPVKYAFTSGGVDFFQFESADNMPILRFTALKEALSIEANRMYNEDLRAAFGAIRACLNQETPDIVEASKICASTEERLEHATFTEGLYQLAAVWYFDYEENPNSYDDQHAYEKIMLWKKEEDIDDFFLKTRFYPQAVQAITSIQSLAVFTYDQRKEIEKYTGNLLSVLSKKKGNPTLISHLQSVLATYRSRTT